MTYIIIHFLCTLCVPVHVCLALPLSPSVTGEAYDLAVANLMGMGFEREQVVRALHASFNNPERAAEYLFSVSCRKTCVLCKIVTTEHVIDCTTVYLLPREY